MPLYGSVFYEAIPSPLGQSPSLLMQPGWLGPFPGRDGEHLEGSGALFSHSLLIWKFYLYFFGLPSIHLIRTGSIYI